MAFTFHLGLEGGGALLTEDERTILLYEFESETAIHYGLQVDWDGDGVLDNFNEAVYMIAPYTIDRGRERNIGAPGQGFEPYRVGTARITLDNSSGRYNPYNPDSELYGNLIPGRKMQFSEASYRGDIETTDILYESTATSTVIYGSSTDYSVARSTYYAAPPGQIVVGQSLISGIYKVYRSLMLFDTSVIPDNAIINSVKISLTRHSSEGGELVIGNLQLVNIDWAAGDISSTSAIEALYDSISSTTDSDDLGALEFYSNNVPRSINLTSIDRINKTGLTTYALRSSEDFDNSAPTTSSQAVVFYWPECPCPDAYKPILAVTYTEPYTTYDIFTGNITDIQPQGWNKTVTITAEDGIAMLRDKDLDEPYTTTDTSMAVLIPRITSIAAYPYSTMVDTGDPTTDESLDVVYLYGSALKELETLANSRLGSIAAEGDGTLAYHSIYEASTDSIYTLTDDVLLNDPVISSPWEYIRDQIKLGARKIKQTLRWLGLDHDYLKMTDASILCDAGETVTFYGGATVFVNDNAVGDTYFDSVFGGVRDSTSVYIYGATMDDIDSTTDLTNLTTNFALSVNSGAYESGFTLTNTTTDTYYIYRIGHQREQYLEEKAPQEYGSTANTINGKLFYDDNKYYYWREIQEYQNFAIVGVRKKVYETTGASFQQSRINTIGNLLYNYLSTSRPRFVVQIEGRPSLQFLMDVEKRVTYNSALLGINEDYRIAGIKHTTLGSTQKVRTTLYLYPVIPSST